VIALVALLLQDGGSERSPPRARDTGHGAALRDLAAEQGDAPVTRAAQPGEESGSRWWLTFRGPGDRPLADVPVTVFPADHVVRTDASGTAVELRLP